MSSDNQSKSLQDSLQAIRSLHEIDLSKFRKRMGRRRLIVAASLALLVLGAISLTESVILSSSVLAFIGLGLTFWSLLFIFVGPASYAHVELVDSTALASVKVIDRIVYELGYYGKGIYLPAKHGIRLFVPAEKDSSAVPDVESLNDGMFYSQPKGLAMQPPGLELARFLRGQLEKPNEPMTLERLQERLPRLLTDRLEIMKDFEMKVDGNTVHTKSTGSLYADFCNDIRLTTRVCSAFGCPMCSAIACLIVDATGRPVVLEEDESTPDGYIIESTYRFIPPSSVGENGLNVVVAAN